MNLNKLLHHFNLGALSKPAEIVTGGILHKTVKITTEKGIFFVKQLNTTLAQFQHFETCENIARHFQINGIPSCCAINIKGNTLFKDDNTVFAVYPFINARHYDADKLSDHQRTQIMPLLLKLHQQRLSINHAPQWDAFILTKAQWQKAFTQNPSWQDKLKPHLTTLIDISIAHQAQFQTLSRQSVVSHRDFTPSNCLWHNDTPILIDWELAGYINPYVECLNVAVDFAMKNRRLRPQLVKSFIQQYLTDSNAAITNPKAIIGATKASWAHWIYFFLTHPNPVISKTDIPMHFDQAIQVIEFLNDAKVVDYFR